MDRFTKHILENIRERELVKKGDTVTVGFSGGADSVCLLSVLWDLAAVLGITVKAVHVNHNLRGEEALRDEKFCEMFCKEREIPFKAVSVDVPAFQKERGLSLEEAARILRYEVLEKEAGEGPVATAHHADDQAETVLLNLLRGTGLLGLRGMESKRGPVIRPLLPFSKDEILSYIDSHGLSFVTDSTNLENDAARNRIRNVILPELKKINAEAPEHILLAGEKAGEADAFLRGLAGEKASAYEVNGGVLVIPKKNLAKEPRILKRYVIIEALKRIPVPLKDWGEVHIGAIEKAFSSGNGYHADLPGKVTVESTKNTVVITKGE